jgi:hypothetical protein
LRLNVAMRNTCIVVLLTASLPNFSQHQIVISITVCYPERSDIKYIWIPPLTRCGHLIASVSIWKCPSKFTNIT